MRAERPTGTGAAASPGAGRRRGREHVVAVVAVLALLVLAAGVLSAIVVERGPRIRTVAGDPAVLVERAGARLVLEADQPLDPHSADGLVVEPRTPVVATVSGTRIELRFDGMLDYGTRYRITAPAVTGRDTGRTASFERTFVTPALETYGLVRDPDHDDRVVRHDLATGRDEVVLSAASLQEYARVGDGVAAVVLGDDGGSAIAVADGAGRRTIALPGAGTVGVLHGSDRSGTIGFVYTGPGDGGRTYTSVLFVGDVRDAAHPIAPVPGLDGQPLQVADWGFVPGTAHLIAHAFDGALYLVDATGAQPVHLLGQHGRFVGFVPGAPTIVADDGGGRSLIDLTDGSVRALPTGDAAGAADRTILAEDGTALRIDHSPLSEGVVTAPPRVFLDSPSGSREVFRAAADGSWVRSACVSPNRRYAALEIVPGGAVDDGYPAASAWTGIRTAIVDLTTAEQVASTPGLQPDWCR